jgi:hypothetical protein
MRWTMTLGFFGALLAKGPPAFCQTPSTVWVAGSVIREMDESWGHQVPSGFGGGVTLGWDKSPKIALEFVADWPASSTTQSVITEVDPKAGPEKRTDRTTTQSPGWIGFVSIQVVSTSRFQLSALTGFGVVSHREAFTHLIEHLGANGNVIGQETGGTSGSFAWGGPAIGLQLAIRLGRHVAVAPDVHLIWFPYADSGTATGIIRTAVAVRWSF